MKTYNYPFRLAYGESKADLSAAVQAEGKRKLINKRLTALLNQTNQSSALDGVYWAAQPLDISQAVPPKSVDRFLVHIDTEEGWKIGGICDGGTHYGVKAVLVYDKSLVLVSDWFSFTLVRVRAK